MIVADISETGARLRRYLDAVEAGDEVIITDRGRRIVRDPRRSASVTERLADLAAAGLVTPPSEAPSDDILPPPRIGGRPLSDIVCEDRR